MKISVIVPCYNMELWLPQCLDSIINQTFSNLEIILIDDGSSDKTGEIIDSYAKRDARIVPVHQANAGLVSVRETGIQMATGNYIGFIDGDDTIEPDMYERLLCNALKYNADISHCGMSFVWPDGRTDLHYGTGNITIQDTMSGVQDLLLGEKIEPSLCNKLFKKSLLYDSCLDSTVLNNEDLLRNFILFGRSRKSVYEDFCGYHYYQRAGSMSKDSAKTLQSIHHILRARRLIVYNCSSEAYPYAIRLWLSTYITVYNSHFNSTDPDISAFCRYSRNVLIREKEKIPYLIRRQQISAWLIIHTPWLYCIIYKLYTIWRSFL